MIKFRGKTWRELTEGEVIEEGDRLEFDTRDIRKSGLASCSVGMVFGSPEFRKTENPYGWRAIEDSDL